MDKCAECWFEGADRGHQATTTRLGVKNRLGASDDVLRLGDKVAEHLHSRAFGRKRAMRVCCALLIHVVSQRV